MASFNVCVRYFVRNFKSTLWNSTQIYFIRRWKYRSYYIQELVSVLELVITWSIFSKMPTMDTHNSPVSVIIDKAFRELKPMNIIQLSLSYIMQHRQNMVSAQLPKATRSPASGEARGVLASTPISSGEHIGKSLYCSGPGQSQQEVLSAHCSRQPLMVPLLTCS